MKANSSFSQGFLAILTVLGLFWLRSGMVLLTGGTFQGILHATLVKFASKNPYPFYQSFLKTTAIPNASTIAQLVMWGELLNGIAILAGVAYVFFKPKDKKGVYLLLSGVLGALFLNLNFWLGGGWTNPTKEILNLLLIGIDVAAAVFVIRAIRE